MLKPKNECRASMPLDGHSFILLHYSPYKSCRLPCIPNALVSDQTTTNCASSGLTAQQYQAIAPSMMTWTDAKDSRELGIHGTGASVTIERRRLEER